ncbi:MAG: hypothetical protein U0575_16360 [Phycisphaerales bacterium]
MSHRILLVSHVPPVPTNTGGNQRTNLLHRALAALGEVDLLLLRDESEVDPADLATLREQHGLRACVPRLPRGRRRPVDAGAALRPSLVDRAAAMPAGATPSTSLPNRRWPTRRGLRLSRSEVTRSPSCAVPARPGRSTCSGLPVAIGVDGVDDEVLRLAAGARRPVARPAARPARQLASIDGVIDPLARRASVQRIAKPSDRRRPALRDAAVLPNIPFVREEARRGAPLQRESRTLLVVGTLWHRPNHDAIDRFLAGLGRGPRASRPRRASDRRLRHDRRAASRWSTFAGVEPIGFVEDLSAEYRRCALAAVHGRGGRRHQHQGGGGVRLCPPVRAQPARVPRLRGSLAAQDSPSPAPGSALTGVDIAAGCVRLLGDPELRDAMARRGRAACAERLSFATFAAIVARDVAPLLDPRGARIHGDAHDTRPS